MTSRPLLARVVLVGLALAALACVFLFLERPDTPGRSFARADVSNNITGLAERDTLSSRSVLPRNEVLRNVHSAFVLESTQLTGTVIDAGDEMGIRDALVYVWDLGEAGVLDTTYTDAAGGFTIGLETTAGIMVGVHANGYISWTSDSGYDFEKSKHVEVRLDRGLAIEGGVVDESGDPLPGIRVRATDNRKLRGPQTDPEFPEFAYVITDVLPVERQVIGPPEKTVTVSDAVTDDAGRFTITGVSRGKSYKLIAVSQEFLVFPPVMAPAGANGVEVLAITASRISVSALDETTGRPIPTFLGIFRIRGVNSSGQSKGIGHSGIGEDGRLSVIWQEQFPWQRETGSVEVIAPGYMPAEGEGVFHDNALHIEVLCKPAEPVVMRVFATWDDGAPVQDDLVLKYRGTQRTFEQAEEDGEHRFRLPRGTWDLLLAPKGALGPHSIAQVYRQEIDEGYTLNVSVNRGGDLEVSLPASEAEPWYVQLRGADRTTYGKVARGDLLIEHLKPGPWTVQASRIGDDESVGRQITIEITTGGRAKASF